MKAQSAKKETAPATKTTAKTPSTGNVLFTKENYKWMLGGLVLMAIGMFLMAGGKSNDPNVFDKDAVYSTTRITIAPLLIVGGLVIEIFAIFRKPKTS